IQIRSCRRTTRALNRNDNEQRASAIAGAFLHPDKGEHGMPSTSTKKEMAVSDVLYALSTICDGAIMRMKVLREAYGKSHDEAAKECLNEIVDFIDNHRSVISRQPTESSITISAPVINISVTAACKSAAEDDRAYAE
ncbi:hypothetical protein, partial [Escherichia coli]|uniref:hypothetical protein n=2 Tax=Escherichia coli TaxID=562 RepID=UPI00203C4699